MSIAGAISNAVSGLTAVARGTQVVSSNLSNALTPGYARRELTLSSRVHQNQAGGVHVDGIARAISNSALAAMRLSSAAHGGADTRANYAARVETLVGTVAEPASLGARLAQFDRSLTEAISRPDSDARLSAATGAARDLIEHINSASAGVQAARTEADADIARQVNRLNGAFKQVESLNRQIVGELARTGDAASLMDQRQKLIDEISMIVPIKELPREHGKIALFTESGQPLLDGSEPVVIGFTPAGAVTSGMTAEDGTLSMLTLDGKVPSALQLESLMGGTLGAAFDFRDRQGAGAQAQLDGFAQELVTRFSDNSLDPTLPPGAPGLFTDDGGAISDVNGLAGRLSLNAAVDPAQGGAPFRLRDGMGASTAGPAGNSNLLSALSHRLGESRAPASGQFGDAPLTLSTLASTLMSNAATERVSADGLKAQTASRHAAMTHAVLAEGVDNDRELENLLALEKAYAANARVIQSAFDMLDTILRI